MYGEQSIKVRPKSRNISRNELLLTYVASVRVNELIRNRMLHMALPVELDKHDLKFCSTVLALDKYTGYHTPLRLLFLLYFSTVICCLVCCDGNRLLTR
jgi:hypothetical protein